MAKSDKYIIKKTNITAISSHNNINTHIYRVWVRVTEEITSIVKNSNYWRKKLRKAWPPVFIDH